MLDISIITINYNQSNLTRDFIESVLKFTPKNIRYEIIVVDNCSEREDYKNLLHILTPFRLTIVRSVINIGFGAGNMLGVQHASGKYIAFINNDVLFIEDCFSSLIQFLKTNPTVGVAIPQQLDRNKQPTYSFDFNHGIRRLIFGMGFINFFKTVKRKKKFYTEPVSVDFIQGCFMFFDNNAFAKVGGFDTNLFLYYEEMDICHRLKQKGFSSYFVPITKFIHLEGESTSKNFIIKKELNISRLYVLRKNHNYLKYTIVRFYFLVKWFLKSLFNPLYFKLVFIIFKGAYTENSMKHQQKIQL